MKRILYLTLGLLALVGLVVGAGCRAPSSPYPSPREIGIPTLELDQKDYQLAASDITQQMLKRGLPKGYVVTLSAVDTKGTTHSPDYMLLQNMIETELDREGTLRFAGLQAMTHGGEAYDDSNKIAALNWENMNPVDKEWLQKFGKRRNINGILYGRISSLDRTQGRLSEVTYTFTWRLGNIETGVVDMTLTYEIRKNIRF